MNIHYFADVKPEMRTRINYLSENVFHASLVIHYEAENGAANLKWLEKVIHFRYMFFEIHYPINLLKDYDLSIMCQNTQA